MDEIESVHAGLDRTFDVPRGRSYIELGGALTQETGSEVWLEVGSHPLENVGLFARAFATPSDLGAEAGIRVTF